MCVCDSCRLHTHTQFVFFKVSILLLLLLLYLSMRMTRLPNRWWHTPQTGIDSGRMLMGAYCRLTPPREDDCVMYSPWNSVGKKHIPIPVWNKRKIEQSNQITKQFLYYIYILSSSTSKWPKNNGRYWFPRAISLGNNNNNEITIRTISFVFRLRTNLHANPNRDKEKKLRPTNNFWIKILIWSRGGGERYRREKRSLTRISCGRERLSPGAVV